MTLKVSIKNQLPLEVMESEIKNLDMKRSLSGQIMVFNHIDMDIVLDEKQGKITAYTKKDFGELVYKSQNRLFDFLFKKGVVFPESVKGSNVFGALEGSYPTEDKVDNLTEIVLFNIANFMQEEQNYIKSFEYVEDTEEDRLLNPDEEDRTELGEVPQKEKKGSLNPGLPGYYYGLSGMYRY
jgi:hypothetical protein|tara:strand:- start:410 stop:955 length:546 start_codon:yes stop_codon:yes gene_type:complete